MTELTYIKLLNNTLDYYFKEEYEKGYNYITKNETKVKGNKAQIYNFRYTLACKAGYIDLAMEILKKSVFEEGFWYSREYLINDNDLRLLREKNDFKKIIKTCEKREIKAKNSKKSKLKIYFPKNHNITKLNSLIIALHGNQENIDIAYNYWNISKSTDYILALPQSSQIEFSNAYSWKDIKKGAEELKKHFNYIFKNHQINKDDILLGGFSAGVKVILKSIVNNYIVPSGLILIAPWVPDIEKNKKLFKVLKEKNIKVYILVGDNDKDCFKITKQFIKLLDENKIKYKSKIIKDLEHDYPDNFEVELKNAVQFINGDNNEI